MNPFLLPPAERLADWKQFRRSLVTLEEEQQWQAVAKYWAQPPLLPSLPLMLILDDPHNIWDMIYENKWCRNSVVLGMEATLRLAGLVDDRMTLRLIQDSLCEILVLVIDDRWMFNYDWGHVTPYHNTHQIIRQWRFSGRHYSTFDG
jgi:hypothetical protein